MGFAWVWGVDVLGTGKVGRFRLSLHLSVLRVCMGAVRSAVVNIFLPQVQKVDLVGLKNFTVDSVKAFEIWESLRRLSMHAKAVYTFKNARPSSSCLTLSADI